MGCVPARGCPFPCFCPINRDELCACVTTLGCYIKEARTSTRPTAILLRRSLIPFSHTSLYLALKPGHENMDNGKPTPEHIEYASVQDRRESDATDASSCSIRGSVDAPSARSVTKEDTQIGMQMSIDETKNNLQKGQNIL